MPDWNDIDWNNCPAVEKVSGRVSGAWVFKDTRLPVTALFEKLEDGVTMDQFMEWFPDVTREHVACVLKHAGNHIK